jgi:hypothetical protein
MKSMHLAVGLILLFIAVPVQSQTMTADQKANIEKEIKEQVTHLYDVIDTLSPEKFVRLWSRDKIIGSLEVTGLESSFEVMEKNLRSRYDPAKSHTTNSVNVMEVHVLSPEMAIAFSTTSFRVELKNGNVVNPNMGNATIWVKESGEWKLAFFQAIV